MSTNRLYYRDPYLCTFQAKVVDSSNEGRRVYLDSTAFYPSSGGQPHDLGTLGRQTVVDVIDEEDRIVHVLDGPVSSEVVEGIVDWARRYDHMQQHTGQHLLSAVFVGLFEAQTLSFHMGAEVSTIELSMKDLTGDQIEQVERRANEIVWQARPVSICFEEAERASGLRKASARSGLLRIIEIDGLDRSACGGTHVRSTAELGPIQILGWERIRGNVRTEFVCGGRALRHAKREHQTVTELSRTTSCAADKLPENVANLRERLAELEKQQQRLTAELARRDGEQIYRNTTPCNDGIRRWLLEVRSIDEEVRARSQAFTKPGKAVVLATAMEPAGVLIACSADSGLNAGSILKQALARVGGRGGGSAILAQGAMPEPSVAEYLKRELGFL